MFLIDLCFDLINGWIFGVISKVAQRWILLFCALEDDNVSRQYYFMNH